MSRSKGVNERLSIRIRPPLASFVRHVAMAENQTATAFVEAAVEEALANVPAQSIAGRTLRTVGWSEHRRGNRP